jgi:hypothetical protein
MTLTTHPHLVPRWRMSRSYTSSPPQAPPWRVAGLLYLLTVFWDAAACSLMMEAINTSETSVNFYETTWCNIQKTVIFILTIVRN